MSNNIKNKIYQDGLSSSFSDRFFLYGVVTVTGAAVMMIELMGTRIIGPFYGVSLFVWSSLISVTLLALAIGYYAGGLLADRQGKIHLSHIIFLASVCIGIIPLISGGVLSATNPLGLRAGAFILKKSVEHGFCGKSGQKRQRRA